MCFYFIETKNYIYFFAKLKNISKYQYISFLKIIIFFIK